MRRHLPLLLLAPLAACKPVDQPAPPAPQTVAPATPPPAPSPTPAPAKARIVAEQTGAYQFGYGYPAQAAAIPALAAWLDADLARSRAELAGEARTGKAEAAQQGFPFNPYQSDTRWQVVADLPGWLSLSALTSGYAGGAHGNYGFIALLWDRQANQRREVASLFTAKAALAAALRPAFCTELNRQRAHKRGQPVDPASTDPFDQCIDPTQSTLILGSSDHQHFNRIGVLIGPYEAGPYVEGSYEVTLPVTPAVLATVRPEFRAAFAAKR